MRWSKNGLASTLQGIRDKTIKDLRPDVEAALVNEQITRKRVEALESVLGRNLAGRLNWLLRGK